MGKSVSKSEIIDTSILPHESVKLREKVLKRRLQSPQRIRSRRFLTNYDALAVAGTIALFIGYFVVENIRNGDRNVRLDLTKEEDWEEYRKKFPYLRAERKSVYEQLRDKYYSSEDK